MATSRSRVRTKGTGIRTGRSSRSGAALLTPIQGRNHPDYRITRPTQQPDGTVEMDGSLFADAALAIRNAKPFGRFGK